jgi:hypothetical protein
LTIAPPKSRAALRSLADACTARHVDSAAANKDVLTITRPE